MEIRKKIGMTSEDELIASLPTADTFVDLFAGDCSFTLAALKSGKYKKVISNDENGTSVLFRRAINGELAEGQRWVSFEEFQKEKETDPYVGICWRVEGLRSYIYDRVLEQWYEALYFARIHSDFTRFKKMGIATNGRARDILDNQKTYARLYADHIARETQNTSLAGLVAKIQSLEKKRKEQDEKCRLYLCDALKASGLTQAEVGRRLGTQMQGHYFGRSQWAFPTREHYARMREFMPLKPFDEVYVRRDDLENLSWLLFKLQNIEAAELHRLLPVERLRHWQRFADFKQYADKLEATNKSYHQIEIHEGDLVFCNLPEQRTDGCHLNIFDFDAFEEWRTQSKGHFVLSH